VSFCGLLALWWASVVSVGVADVRTTGGREAVVVVGHNERVDLAALDAERGAGSTTTSVPDHGRAEERFAQLGARVFGQAEVGQRLLQDRATGA
jgi:hypothetical protein